MADLPTNAPKLMSDTMALAARVPEPVEQAARNMRDLVARLRVDRPPTPDESSVMLRQATSLEQLVGTQQLRLEQAAKLVEEGDQVVQAGKRAVDEGRAIIGRQHAELERLSGLVQKLTEENLGLRRIGRTDEVPEVLEAVRRNLARTADARLRQSICDELDYIHRQWSHRRPYKHPEQTQAADAAAQEDTAR